MENPTVAAKAAEDIEGTLLDSPGDVGYALISHFATLPEKEFIDRLTLYGNVRALIQEAPTGRLWYSVNPMLMPDSLFYPLN